MNLVIKCVNSESILVWFLRTQDLDVRSLYIHGATIIIKDLDEFALFILS
jgi:hypothetical protein